MIAFEKLFVLTCNLKDWKNVKAKTEKLFLFAFEFSFRDFNFIPFSDQLIRDCDNRECEIGQFSHSGTEMVH